MPYWIFTSMNFCIGLGSKNTYSQKRDLENLGVDHMTADNDITDYTESKFNDRRN